MSLIDYNRHNNLGLGTSLVEYGFGNPNNLGLGLRLFRKTLGKLLGKLANTAISYVAAVVETALPGIGKPIADELRDFGIAVERAILDLKALNAPLVLANGAYEPTPSEMQIIDRWFIKFKPFVEGLTQEVAAALKLTNKQAMLTGLNAVLNKINAVQDHYAVTKETGLSQNAIDQRNQLIYETFKTIHYTITEGLKQLKGTDGLTSVQVTFPMNQYNYQPLFTSSIVTTVTGENYKIASTSTGGTKLPIGNNTGVITLPGTTKPGTVTPITSTKETPVVPVNTGTLPTKEGTTDTTKDSAPTTGGDSTKKIVFYGALLALLAGGVAYATRKKKGASKSKSKNK